MSWLTWEDIEDEISGRASWRRWRRDRERKLEYGRRLDTAILSAALAAIAQDPSYTPVQTPACTPTYVPALSSSRPVNMTSSLEPFNQPSNMPSYTPTYTPAYAPTLSNMPTSLVGPPTREPPAFVLSTSRHPRPNTPYRMYQVPSNDDDTDTESFSATSHCKC